MKPINTSSGHLPTTAFPHLSLYISYTYPESNGFKNFAILPKEAFYDSNLRESILPYEAVQKSNTPDSLLMDFLQSIYTAATTAKWDRSKLERP